MIESFELGFRMQSAVPEVMDISKESERDAGRCTASDAAGKAGDASAASA